MTMMGIDGEREVLVGLTPKIKLESDGKVLKDTMNGATVDMFLDGLEKMIERGTVGGRLHRDGVVIEVSLNPEVSEFPRIILGDFLVHTLHGEILGGHEPTGKKVHRFGGEKASSRRIAGSLDGFRNLQFDGLYGIVAIDGWVIGIRGLTK